jgi:site-specific DNA-cytosine methylase
MRRHRALFTFCGLGAGALGFIRAAVKLLGTEHRFECIGGIDLDPDACADFRRLTRSPALCADISTLTPEQLRAFAGDEAPDMVFGSPPCVGASGLLSDAKSREARYVELNRLAQVWTDLMLSTWSTRPRLVIYENVPGITRRAADTLKAVRKSLRAAGYVIHEGTHDCGEIGGLAQRRKRWLMVARLPSSVASLLYQPPKKRVRGVGEVLGELPMPGDPAAGALHRLPRVSWLTWVRLALIPAGGDWRDLPPAVTLPNVAAKGASAYSNVYRVVRWDDPSAAVIGATRPGSGALSIADPRLHDPAKHSREHNDHVYGVLPWTKSAHAVAGESYPGNGPFTVADPRIPTPAFRGSLGVMGWNDTSGTVPGESAPSNGRFSVADPRLGCEPRAGAYGVVPWTSPSGAITAAMQHDNDEASIADPRIPEDWRDPPSDPPPVIVALDGTWHRPMTTLELAVLQGLPATLDGQPLTLTARTEAWRRKHIGNAVPVGTAEAIARQMLLTLAYADAGTWSLSSDGADVWVVPDGAIEPVEAIQ